MQREIRDRTRTALMAEGLSMHRRPVALSLVELAPLPSPGTPGPRQSAAPLAPRDANATPHAGAGGSRGRSVAAGAQRPPHLEANPAPVTAAAAAPVPSLAPAGASAPSPPATAPRRRGLTRPGEQRRKVDVNALAAKIRRIMAGGDDDGDVMPPAPAGGTPGVAHRAPGAPPPLPPRGEKEVAQGAKAPQPNRAIAHRPAVLELRLAEGEREPRLKRGDVVLIRGSVPSAWPRWAPPWQAPGPAAAPLPPPLLLRPPLRGPHSVEVSEELTRGGAHRPWADTCARPTPASALRSMARGSRVDLVGFVVCVGPLFAPPSSRPGTAAQWLFLADGSAAAPHAPREDAPPSGSPPPCDGPSGASAIDVPPTEVQPDVLLEWGDPGGNGSGGASAARAGTKRAAGTDCGSGGGGAAKRRAVADAEIGCATGE